MKKLLILIATTALFVGCQCAKTENYVVKSPYKHVIIVGFDGLSGYAIDNGANMPTLRQLMSEGSYTTECRSILPSSSAANWASMFMGASSELHGYNTWGSKTPDLPSRVLTENGIFPNIYSEYRRANPEAELGYFYEWGGMRYLVDTLSISNLQPTTADVTAQMSVEYIKSAKPELFAAIFDQPDGAGHTYGWESQEYMDLLPQLDAQLADIVQAIKDAGIADETLLIVSSDHGGIETGHGGITMKEMQTPVVLWGKGIKKNHKLEQSVMIYDIASTILSASHVPQPQVWIGRPISEAFEK